MCPSSCLSFCVSSSPPALQCQENHENGPGARLPRPACRKAYGHGSCSIGQVSTRFVIANLASNFRRATATSLWTGKSPPAFLNSLFCRSAAATACFSSWLFLVCSSQPFCFDKLRGQESAASNLSLLPVREAMLSLAHAEFCTQISQAFSPWFGPWTLGWTKGAWKLYKMT